MKVTLLYIAYFIAAIFFMSWTHLIEIFSPLLFFHLKKNNYKLFWLFGLISVVILEGISFFHFSLFLPFLFSQFLIFQVISRVIDKENFVFDFLYFFSLSLCLFFLVNLVKTFLNIEIKNFNCLVYFVSCLFFYYIFYFFMNKYEFA